MGACDIASYSPRKGGERTGLSDKQAQSQDMILTHMCEVIAMGKRKPCLQRLANAVGPQRVKMAPSQFTEKQSGGHSREPLVRGSCWNRERGSRNDCMCVYVAGFGELEGQEAEDTVKRWSGISHRLMLKEAGRRGHVGQGKDYEQRQRNKLGS